MLRELAPDQLWVAEMPASRMGFEYGARMTVIRLQDGGLFVHSPIALDPPLRQAIDRLGPVRVIVSPSRFHYMHVPEFARAYPEARLYAVPGSRGKLKELPVHALLADEPDPAWSDELDQATFRGSALYDEVDFFHR